MFWVIKYLLKNKRLNHLKVIPCFPNVTNIQSRNQTVAVSFLILFFMNGNSQWKLINPSQNYIIYIFLLLLSIFFLLLLSLGLHSIPSIEFHLSNKKNEY